MYTLYTLYESSLIKLALLPIQETVLGVGQVTGLHGLARGRDIKVPLVIESRSNAWCYATHKYPIPSLAGNSSGKTS